MKKLAFILLFLAGCAQIDSVFEAQQVVVWQSENHVAFPSVERLDNDELVCVYRHGKGHVSPDGTILLSRSATNGRTWMVPDTIINTRWDSRDPSITRISNGSLLVSFFQTRYDSEGKIVGAIGVYVAESLDGGYTWYSPRMILAEDYKWVATSSKIVELADGTLLLPMYGAKEGEKSQSLVAVSRDFGKSWKEIYPVAADSAGNIDFNEPALTVLPDGRILCIHRTAGDGHFLYRNYSNDGGKTWSTPERINLQGQAPGLLLTKNNVLLCGYRDFSPNGTSYAKSYDFGLTFEAERIISLFDYDRAYPEFVDLGKHIMAVYYQARKEGGGTILASFLDPPAVPAPNGLAATLQPDSSVVVRWNRVNDAHYYRVYRSEMDSANVEKKPELIATVVNNFYNDKKVTAGKLYRVKAVASRAELIENSGAESPFSDPAKID